MRRSHSLTRPKIALVVGTLSIVTAVISVALPWFEYSRCLLPYEACTNPITSQLAPTGLWLVVWCSLAAMSLLQSRPSLAANLSHGAAIIVVFGSWFYFTAIPRTAELYFNAHYTPRLGIATGLAFVACEQVRIRCTEPQSTPVVT